MVNVVSSRSDFCSVTNLTKVSIIIYYRVNTETKILQIPTYGCEIRVIRASRVLDPVLQVSKKDRRLIEISAKLVNSA